MRRHAAGVCILTAGEGDTLNGMAVTSATSFSFDPPSILVCVNEAASIATELSLGARFGLTVLGQGHKDVAERFSRKPSGRARFAHPAWRLEKDRTPWLQDAPANLQCVVERTVGFGTHVAVIGSVRGVHLGAEQPTLIYRDGAFG